jgi:hypothetical protein
MNRRISITEMLIEKQMCYQQSKEKIKLKSIICSEKMNYQYRISNSLQGTESWRLNKKWVIIRQYKRRSILILLEDYLKILTLAAEYRIPRSEIETCMKPKKRRTAAHKKLKNLISVLKLNKNKCGMNKVRFQSYNMMWDIKWDTNI